MIQEDIVDYLETLATLLRSKQRALAAETGLQQVHMQILYYLGRCNHYSDSLLVLSEFLGQTKGTVSTSVALLEKKGLLKKRPDKTDKRKVHLQLTRKGVELAETQSQVLWHKTMHLLSKQDKAHIGSALELLLRKVQQANDYKLFGICRKCRHLCQEDSEFRCGLTDETLYDDDLEKLCVFHEKQA